MNVDISMTVECCSGDTSNPNVCLFRNIICESLLEQSIP
jgi:hypothetical protein